MRRRELIFVSHLPPPTGKVSITTSNKEQTVMNSFPWRRVRARRVDDEVEKPSLVAGRESDERHGEGGCLGNIVWHATQDAAQIPQEQGAVHWHPSTEHCSCNQTCEGRVCRESVRWHASRERRRQSFDLWYTVEMNHLGVRKILLDDHLHIRPGSIISRKVQRGGTEEGCNVTQATLHRLS
jgi:hypothetical protein